MTAPLNRPGSSATVLVIKEDIWPSEAVSHQLDTAQRRFAECGVALSFVDTPSPAAQRELRFISSLEVVEGTPIEGRAFAFRMPKQAEVAWARPDGTPLDHKQTTAHELGHLFGLSHAPLHSINLMAPHGCEICRFSQAQCAVLSSTAAQRP